MTLLINIHPVYHFEKPLITNGHGKNVASRLWWGEAAFQGVHYIILLLLQGNSASFTCWKCNMYESLFRFLKNVQDLKKK